MKIKKMNIDELPAGPELDGLVAEKVMGWKWNSEIGEWIHENSIPYGPHDGGFRPSTSISDAWQVMEKMKAHDDFIVCRSIESCRVHKAINWCVVIVRKDRPSFNITVAATTAPLAICRAALHAIGGREGKL